MHKINMYDNNNAAFVTGGVSYFVESLEDFETHWKPQAGEDAIKIYEKSKSGYFANQFMASGSDHDMVITDLGGEILEEKTLVEEDVTFTVYNGWHCSSEIYAKKRTLTVARLKFQENDYIVAKYRLEGVCDRSKYPWNQYEYEQISVWGNPILCVDIQSKEEDFRRKVPENGCWEVSAPKETFANDTVETFVWLIVESCPSIYEIPPEERDAWKSTWYQLSEDQLVKLFSDIKGEAG